MTPTCKSGLSSNASRERSLSAARRLSFCGLLVIGLATLTFAQETKVEITDPKVPAGQVWVAPGVLELTFAVTKDVRSVRVVVTSKNDADKTTIKTESKTFEYSQSVRLLKGVNKIELFGFKEGEDEPSASTSLSVTCSGKKCGAVGTSESGVKGTGGSDEDKTTGNVTLKSPSSPVTKGPIDSLILVKGGIKKLSVVVYDVDGNRIDYQPSVEVTDADGKLGIATPRLKISKGQNTVRIFDPAKPTDKANETLAVVDCPACSKIEIVAAEGPKPEQKGSIKITSPESGTTYVNAKTATLTVKVDKKTGAGETDVSSLAIKVKNNKKDVPQDSASVAISAEELSKARQITVNLKSGVNQITVQDPTRQDQEVDYVEIKCEGKCGSDADLKEIAILQPKIPEGQTSLNVIDKSTQDAYISVAKGSKITNIQYDVINEGKPVLTSPPMAVDASAKDVTLPMTLKFLRGSNTIRIYDADHPGSNNDASIIINCTGENCATDFLVSTIATNSRFTRVVVGIEQAGASSAESKSNPFLDFFFTTPLLFDKPKPEWEWVPVAVIGPDGNPLRKPNGELQTVMIKKIKPNHLPPAPRFGAWSQVRFSATPQQTSAFGVFPSNFVNQVTDPSKVIELVQSFDFLAGLEYQAFNPKGWIWTLIPGVRQRSSVYLTVGAGAISPLTVKRESAQIFTVPAAAIPAMGITPAVPAHPLREEFVRRFGDPGDKIYVGFVPLERDRFFRQYYLGLRIKTHYCDDPECVTYKNRFPSIVDVSFGQNEAVTGGRLTAEIRDPGTDIIKRRRSWVGRVDAFFPLPFREANFLYLYGTAIMKLGGGKVRIENALFLDSPGTAIQITDPRIYTPPPDLQPTRIDRDYYKIGIGVNLTDLFNRNKPKQ